MAAIDDLTAAAQRATTALSNLEAALAAASPDLQPVIDSLEHKASQQAEDVLNPPASSRSSLTR